MVLIVLRHGQSIYNKENRFTGLTDVSLSEIGRSEALDAGLLLKKYNFDCIFTSDLKRTDETANIIRYNSNNALIINMKSNKALNERDYGELTGKNKTELKEMYGEKVVHIWRRSYLERPPGGECLHDVRLRVADYFDNEIKKRNIKPTKLLPLWDIMGVTLGFGTAMLGEKAAMLCTASVEEVIDGHYKDQTYKLGEDEKELKEKIMKFRDDELHHKDIAYDNGATKEGLFGVLDKIIKTSSKIAITISQKI